DDQNTGEQGGAHAENQLPLNAALPQAHGDTLSLLFEEPIEYNFVYKLKRSPMYNPIDPQPGVLSTLAQQGVDFST
ncbi:MAG: hypothetical protein ACLGID_01310, partial [Gammaproteobacteria bacterium]